MNELLKCPFCGGEAKLVCRGFAYSVSCTRCSARTALKEDEQNAVRYWNTRTPIQRIVERLEGKSFWTESTFDGDGYCNDDSEEAVLLSDVIEIIGEEGVI